MKRPLLAALAAAAVAVSAPAQAQTQGVTDTEIILGAHTDLSGIFAAFGAPFVQAAQLHFDEVNAAGGVHGRRIRYIVEDHGYQVPRAVQAVNKLVNRDRIFAMFGGLGTPHNLAAFRVQDPRNVPNVSPVTAARQMLEGPEHLRYAGTASYYDATRLAVAYMIEEQGGQNFCAMYLPTDFGEEVIHGLRDELDARGLTLTAETQHRPDEIDFAGPLQRLRAEGCDTIAVALGLRQIMTVTGTAKRMDWDAKFLGSSAAFHTVVAKAPGGVTEGFFASSGWQDIEKRLDNPVAAEWVQKYNAATGEQLPGTGALLGRQAAELLVRALEDAGRDLTVESFTAAMQRIDYFDEIGGVHMRMGPGDHQAADTVFISQVVDGSWEVIREIDASAVSN